MAAVITPLWLAVLPGYNVAVAEGADAAIGVFEPDDAGHRVWIEAGRVTLTRWVYGRSPMEFSFNLKTVTFNGALLLALLLASPMAFGKRWAVKVIASLLALYLFHVLVVYMSAVNPTSLSTSAAPAHVEFYLERLGPVWRKLSAAVTLSLHSGGRAFAPLLIWAIATNKKAL